MSQSNSNSIKWNLSAGLNIAGAEIETEAGSEESHKKDQKILINIGFKKQDNIKTINPEIFGNYNRFYYLPKDSKWLDIIRRRINLNANDEKYVYSYTNLDCFSTNLSAKLKQLNMSFSYDSRKFEKINFEYNVTYFPFSSNNPKPEVKDIMDKIAVQVEEKKQTLDICNIS